LDCSLRVGAGPHKPPLTQPSGGFFVLTNETQSLQIPPLRIPLPIACAELKARPCPKENFAVSQLANNPLLMTRAQDIGVMLKGAAIAALVLAIASQLDQYFSNGRYTDVTVAMLRQIRHSFGV
jgi:hypothetical protein